MSELSKLEPLSNAVATPIERAYRAGGLVLGLLTLGAILMLAPYLFGNRDLVSYVVLGLGAALILSVVVYFYVIEMPKLRVVRNKIRENEELVDTVQQTAIEATQLALHLQALAFKHADQVARIIQTVRPMMKSLPLVGKYADNPALVRAQDLSASIVDTTRTLNEIVGDIQSALIASDAGDLKKYLARLEAYKDTVQHVLRQAETPEEIEPEGGQWVR
jgi:hypothetical protein